MASVRQRKPQATEDSAYSSDTNGGRFITRSNFQWKLWLLFCIENWILDFGRPIFALFVSAGFPLSLPSIGDYCHMLYNTITALVLISLLQNTRTPIPRLIQVYVCVYTDVHVHDMSVHYINSVMYNLFSSIEFISYILCNGIQHSSCW